MKSNAHGAAPARPGRCRITQCRHDDHRRLRARLHVGQQAQAPCARRHGSGPKFRFQQQQRGPQRDQRRGKFGRSPQAGGTRPRRGAVAAAARPGRRRGRRRARMGKLRARTPVSQPRGRARQGSSRIRDSPLCRGGPRRHSARRDDRTFSRSQRRRDGPPASSAAPALSARFARRRRDACRLCAACLATRALQAGDTAFRRPLRGRARRHIPRRGGAARARRAAVAAICSGAAPGDAMVLEVLPG